MGLAQNILANDKVVKALGKIYAETMRSQTKTRSGWASGNEAEVDAKDKEEMTVTESELREMVAAGVRKLMEAYDQSQREIHPAVYVGTYGKYNNSSLEGEWVKLDDFSSKEEFLRYCMQELHANEPDAELMFQDSEYVPDCFIDESWISDRLWDFINIREPYEMKLAVANGLSDADEAINVLENGDYRVFWDCSDVEDVVREYLDEGILPSNPAAYFDYETFGHDCAMDEGDSIYEEFGIEEGDDQSLGELIIDNMYGGIDNFIQMCQKQNTLENYIDIPKLARDLSYEATFVEFDGGIVELF